MSIKRVLSVTRWNTNLEKRYDFVTVVWGFQVAETKTTIKFDRLIASTYYRGVRVGHGAYMSRKPFSIYKKSKALPDGFERTAQESAQDAIRHVLTQGQVFNATILHYDNNCGEGMAEVHGVGTVSIYGCNAFNALTAYSETACITMKKGEVFSCKLANMGTHLTCKDFIGTFDQQRSDSLDHSKLAFKKSNGKLVSGLFS